MKIGVQLYSLKDEIKELGVDAVLKMVADAGYDCVEFAGFYGLTPKERLARDCPDAKLVMQVHDELIVECPDKDVLTVRTILKEEMEGVAQLSVPLTVEVSSGKNWLEQN